MLVSILRRLVKKDEKRSEETVDNWPLLTENGHSRRAALDPQPQCTGIYCTDRRLANADIPSICAI
ncbi:hypothetical protein BOMU111920_07860 [Bordetella muralis]